MNTIIRRGDTVHYIDRQGVDEGLLKVRRVVIIGSTRYLSLEGQGLLVPSQDVALIDREVVKTVTRDLTYFDEQLGERYFPYVIEPSAGADRATLAFLIDAYHQEEVRNEKRTVLRFHKALAPIKVAVLPLLRT